MSNDDFLGPLSDTGLALELIANERQRQNQLAREGIIPHTCADSACSDAFALAVLMEEVGEVGSAMQERSSLATVDYVQGLLTELAQVGAVVTAWIERLNKDASP